MINTVRQQHGINKQHNAMGGSVVENNSPISYIAMHCTPTEKLTLSKVKKMYDWMGFQMHHDYGCMKSLLAIVHILIMEELLSRQFNVMLCPCTRLCERKLQNIWHGTFVDQVKISFAG